MQVHLTVIAITCVMGSAASQVHWFNAEGRYDHAMAGGANLLLFGGTSGNGNYLGDTWSRGVGGNWVLQSASVGPPATRGHAMALESIATDAVARVVLFGGRRQNALNPLSDETWRWTGDRWNSGGTLTPRPPARERHSMVLDRGRNVVVLFGGSDLSSSPLADTWEWDGAAWTSRTTPPNLLPRWGHAMAYDDVDGAVILFGGNGFLRDTWRYDGTAWTRILTALADTPPGRFDHSMAFDQSRREIVLFGGEGAAGLLQDTWVWDRNLPGWVQRSPSNPPTARAGHKLHWDASLQPARLVLVGGRDAAGSAIPDAWQWTGSDWANPQPAPRVAASMVFDQARGTVLLFGGRDTPVGSVYFGDTWTWGSAGWNRMSPPGATPQARGGSGIVNDPLRHLILMHGGYTGAQIWDDTWAWDGSAWGLMNPPGARPASAHSGVAFDRRRDRVVLFGGVLPNGALSNATWEWDGTAWSQRAPAHVPPPRYLHAMAYDDARGVAVMFGGFVVGPGAFNDTWTWDGTDWTQAQPSASPGPRFGHAMVFDPGRGVVIVSCGEYSQRPHLQDNQVWEWNGANWAQRSPIPAPLGRVYAATAFDLNRGRMVMFSGWNESLGALSDTWEYGTSGVTAPLGQGCAGPNGTPTLAAAGAPVIGGSLSMALSGLPFPPLQRFSLLYLGFSVDTWQGLPLPLDLTPAGSIDCRLYQSLDILLAIHGANTATSVLPIPNDPGLVGATVFPQALGVAMGFNPLGIISSNALTVRIGGR